MRLLYITETFPFPLTSGALRHYHLVRELSGHGHEMTLLSLVGADWQPQFREALEPYASVETFESGSEWRSRRERLRRRLGGLAGGESAARRLAGRARALARSRPFDAVLVSGKRTLPIIDRLPPAPLVVDLCDATSHRALGAMRYARPLRLPALMVEFGVTRWLERLAIREADEIVFISERDRRLTLGSERDGRGPVVPNGIDTEAWRRATTSREPGIVIFTGAMDYPPNADAALVLIREVMPIVRAEVSDARLWIVGRDPSPLLLANAAPNTLVTGIVPDLRPYLERATVFAAPLRFGVGMQNKLLEAMAMGVPIVTTSLAAEGIRSPGAGRPPVDIADDAAGLATRIIAHLRSAEVDPAPAEAGRSYVERAFQWPNSANALEAVIARAADRHAPEASPQRC